MKLQKRLMYTGILFVFPAFLFFLIFRIVPMLRAVWVSLYRYDLITDKQFLGLGNYIDLFQDRNFLVALKLTAYYVVGSCIPLVVVAMLLALALNRNELRGRKLFSSLVFIPVILSTVIASIIWKLLYHYWGPVNAVLVSLSFEPIDWLNSAKFAMPAIIITSVWKEAGYYTLILLAGLQIIPEELYEAAWLDGAGRWSTFWKITWPLMAPALAFVGVIVLIQSMRKFGIFLIMTEGGPGESTRVLSLMIYQTAFLYLKMGRASAMSLIMLLILILLTAVQLKAFKRDRYA